MKRFNAYGIPKETMRTAIMAATRNANDQLQPLPLLPSEIWQRIASFVGSRPAIAAGGFHTVVLSSDGNIYTFGQGNSGQLGNGQNSNYNTPQSISLTETLPDIKATAIAAGHSNTVALGSDRNLYTFGTVNSGQLGNGQNSNFNTPQVVQAE
jgi:alpha-tubulin suppressor-like RCC1 family protein